MLTGLSEDFLDAAREHDDYSESARDFEQGKSRQFVNDLSLGHKIRILGRLAFGYGFAGQSFLEYEEARIECGRRDVLVG